MEILRFGPYQTNSGHWFWTDYVKGSGRKGKRKTVLVHREIMEQHLGRKLGPDEVVHHIDHNPSNNVLSNLEVKSVEEHGRHHARPAEMVEIICPCDAVVMKPARQIRQNQGSQGKAGPFCSKSCAARWSRRKQIESGRSNLRA